MESIQRVDYPNVGGGKATTRSGYYFDLIKYHLSNTYTETKEIDRYTKKCISTAYPAGGTNLNQLS